MLLCLLQQIHQCHTKCKNKLRNTDSSTTMQSEWIYDQPSRPVDNEFSQEYEDMSVIRTLCDTGRWFEKETVCSCNQDTNVWCYFYQGRKETYIKISPLTWNAFCSCIYFKLKNFLLHTATNEMSLDVCSYHQNTVKAKGIQSSFQCQHIWPCILGFFYFKQKHTVTILFSPRLRQLLCFKNAIL